MQKVDCLIVGGGILGVAVARHLQSTFSHLKCLLVEKENGLAKHQTGHNSGVIHAGIYYKTDSLKAKLCIEGLKRIYEYCDANHLPYKKCGKLIVAVERDQLERLDNIYRQATENGVQDVKMLIADVEQQLHLEYHRLQSGNQLFASENYKNINFI
ncbi:unnamed protein product [Rotaria sordida]|uniref:L-2-hydroxyglutarate dehydrogenase, mitochondrial n=1 Tax=Rotaria sordida TaxID=392033 RepID=A0A813WDZ1_9BILA|nr:unnamed protein product [Rotaria sordida]